MHFDTKTAAAAIAVFTLLCNVLLSYFGVPNTLACNLAAASPSTQQAAAAILAR